MNWECRYRLAWLAGSWCVGRGWCVWRRHFGRGWRGCFGHSWRGCFAGAWRLEQLDQHAQCRARLQERHLAVRARPRLLVDHLDTLIFEIAQVRLDVGRAEAEVVQTWSASLEEARDGRIRIGWLEQLDQRISGLDEGDLELAVGQLELIEDFEPELFAVKLHGRVDRRDGHADVVNRQRFHASREV